MHLASMFRIFNSIVLAIYLTSLLSISVLTNMLANVYCAFEMSYISWMVQLANHCSKALNKEKLSLLFPSLGHLKCIIAHN